MKSSDLIALGIPRGEPLETAKRACKAAAQAGWKKRKIRGVLEAAIKQPEKHAEDPLFGALAEALRTSKNIRTVFSAPAGNAPWKQWGTRLDPQSVEQMEMACRLPVSVAGALMPDAHVGYGLPIGGVLATENAVIPYAVGVDIACRVKMTVLDLPLSMLEDGRDKLKSAIAAETRFGVGANFQRTRRQHAVMDANWNVTAVTKAHKDKAWDQLGTSGSGNHFVEFGILELMTDAFDAPAGTYLALLSHSGSRGTGAAVCDTYSKIAKQRCRDIKGAFGHLSWLTMDSNEGQEYWAAMQLMGQYAAANHACIHHHIARNLGARVLVDIENHHNFAWKEKHLGRDLIVHRKGATPAAKGDIGIIPGSMASPCYIVRGLGNEAALNSAAHGAGRVMSRTAAKKAFNWHETKKLLADRGVELISAGLDEVPGVYKDINEVMAAQSDLVETLGRFRPKLVKMAPAGERPED